MAEIKNLIFGLLVAIFFITVIVIGASNSVEEMGVNFNESQLQKYNKLASINNMSEDLRSSSNITQQSSVIDILGDFFKTGYKSIIITEQSIDITTEMANNGIDDADIGENSKNFKGLVILSIVLIVVFAIIGILVGKEL